IVYTSNVFAILGLRALYFLLAGVLEMFRYLKVGLSLVLCFVGVKMVIVDIYEIPITVSLFIVASILGLSVLASIMAQRAEKIALPADEVSIAGRSRTGASHTSRRAAVAVAVAGIVLSLLLVKWVSIQTGPSWHAAITAIRLAETEAAEAKWANQATTPVISEVDRMLNAAWTFLQQDRYEQALGSAWEAKRLLREQTERSYAAKSIPQGGSQR
ncbi:MAG TPA: hypothetical protein VNO43_09050, partial [Candidatus Eisenbacteria bacterium]|nr:hypothetical protein [Candidatus Eisenbacteria bacterium]